MTTPSAPTPLTYAAQKALAVAVFKRVFVANVLAAANGNVNHAARLAGLDESNLRRLIRETSCADDTLVRPCQEKQTRRKVKRRSG